MPTANNKARVHVVGCPRSGTTLMTELLRYAYDFAGAAEHERSLFDPIPNDSFPYLTKKPADTVRISKAFDQDENLHVIALIRDPRAVTTSVHWSHPELYFVGYKRWRLYADVIRSHQQHSRYLTVRYEDLLHNPDAVQARIDTAMPFLTKTRDFSNYPEGIETLDDNAEKALGGIRPFDTSRIEAWREHLPRIKREFDANPTFQADLETLEYEVDRQWAQCLEGVEGAGTSYKDAGDTWPKSWEIAIRYWLRTRKYLRSRS